MCPWRESRARFEEAYDIIRRAWTEEIFSFEGKFWSYKDVAMWPRPCSSHIRRSGCPSSAARNRSNSPAGTNRRSPRATAAREAARRHYPLLRAMSSQAGHRITPDHLSLGISAYVADSKAEAVRESGPYHLYFNRTLFSHGNFTETDLQRQAGYSSDASSDYVRPEKLPRGRSARGFPQHDHGRCRAPGRADAAGARRTK